MVAKGETLERASETGWEGQEESLRVLHLPLPGGVFSTQLQGFGQAEFGISHFPFKRGWNVGAGRFCSSWPGRGSLAHPLTAPPTPRGLGEGEAPRLACPTLTGHWAWRPVGKAFPGPSGPKACLCSPSLRPALLFGAEAPELSEGRHSPPQC